MATVDKEQKNNAKSGIVSVKIDDIKDFKRYCIDVDMNYREFINKAVNFAMQQNMGKDV